MSEIHDTPRAFACQPPGGSAEDCPQAPMLKKLQDGMNRILKFIDGDDSEDRPGLRVRLDRLEQTQKRLDAWKNIIAGAVLTLLAVEAVKLLSTQISKPEARSESTISPPTTSLITSR